ncbi:MAG: ATP-dependent Clp protease proteolytic subunit, partial [Balneolaceae bacterium]
ASDIEIEAMEIIRIKKELTGILADHSGQDHAKVTEDSDRNKWLSADEAVEYGLVDQVMRRSKSDKKKK